MQDGLGKRVQRAARHDEISSSNTYPLIPGIPYRCSSNIKADTKGEGARKDCGDVYAVPLENEVVEARGELIFGGHPVFENGEESLPSAHELIVSNAVVVLTDMAL